MSLESVFCFALLRYEEGVFNAFSTCARLIGKKPHCKGWENCITVSCCLPLWPVGNREGKS